MKQILKKRIMAATVGVMAPSIVFPAAAVMAAPYKTGWTQIDGTWYYYNSKGEKVTDSWAKDSSGRWFYLGNNGVMVTNGWAQDSSGRWFYLESDGAMTTNGWAQDSSKYWFYLGSDGAMVTSSWIEYNGKSYYLNSGGDMAFSTTTPDGSTVDSTGAKVTSGTGTSMGGTQSGGVQPGGTPPSGTQPGGAPPDGGNGGASTVSTGTGAYSLTNGETLTEGTYSSTNADENAVRADNSITASLNNVTVNKTAGSASSNDASSFYGLNSAVLALDNSTLNITGGTVTASAEGANGVFAYNGATVNIKNTTVNVSGGNSGGIEVSGGGKLYASNLTVNSKVKAAIRSDRGGGTMVVDGGTYTTEGSSGAPAIYSTADITVNNATLTANTSEAVVVEGLNSVTLNNCDVTGNMTGTYGGNSSENIHNVMLYQSMSGDAEVGNSSFKMTGGSLTSKNGDMFYVTNTNCTIQMSNVKVNLADNTNLLVVSGNDASRGWGKAGSNGGVCTFTASDQTLSGDIKVDSISKLDMNISDSSAFTGSINSDGTNASALSVTLDSSSTWTLTADSYITGFNGSMSNVNTNGHTLYVNGVAMN